MISKRECETDITEWAKVNNRFVNGLNYVFNGEDYEYLQLNYSGNQAIAELNVTMHLFKEGDFIHLTMTLGLRILIDTITNYIRNKYLLRFEPLKIIELHSIKIERIEDLDNITIAIEEIDHKIQSDAYLGSFVIIFGNDKMIFNSSISCKIAQAGSPGTYSSKIRYDDYHFDIKNVYINQHGSRCIPISYKNKIACSLFNIPFPILFNILINQLFVYCSYEYPEKGSRFVLAREIHYTQDNNEFLGNEMFLIIQDKEHVKAMPYYKILSHDDCYSFQLQMEFLYKIMTN